MKLCFSKGIVYALCLETLSCGERQQSTSDLASGGGEKTVCRRKDIPSGWVIVAHKTDIDCPNFDPAPGKFNAFVIKVPGDVETVCYDSPVPGGYTKGREKSTVRCVEPRFSNFKNAFEIRRR